MIFTDKKITTGLVTLCFLVVCITGCGTNYSASNSAMNMSLNSIGSTQPMATVKMTIPKKAKVGNRNQISVLVTQGGQPVHQVDDVMFEIWKDVPNSSHEIIHAKRTGNGTYSIEYRFKQAGTYNVMYHVVADGNMIMTGPQRIAITN